MKKEYLSPNVKTISWTSQHLLAASIRYSLEVDATHELEILSNKSGDEEWEEE